MPFGALHWVEWEERMPKSEVNTHRRDPYKNH